MTADILAGRDRAPADRKWVTRGWLAYTDLASLFEHGGAVVAGAAALFGVVGFIIGQARRDIGQISTRAYGRGWDLTDPLRYAERLGSVGGVMGLGVVIARELGWA